MIIIFAKAARSFFNQITPRSRNLQASELFFHKRLAAGALANYISRTASHYYINNFTLQRRKKLQLW